MAVKICDDLMTLEVDGTIIARAERRPGGWWEVTNWPRFFDRNQAITALTVTELLEQGYGNDDPLIVALREELGGTELTLRHRLGTGTVEIFTPGGTLMVTRRLAPPGAGPVVRTPAHRAALEAVVLSQFSAARPCDRKANRPPGQAALAERAALLGPGGPEPSADLEQLAGVIRLAFPDVTTVPGAEVPA